jgi:hypothetical protein
MPMKTMTTGTTTRLITGTTQNAQSWQAVNDGVMGGVSGGRFKITADETLEFFAR